MGVEQYEPIIADAARVYNIDPELIRRMIRQESSGNTLARSNKGASGLMQLMPATAKDLGVRNILDPRDNIVGGTRYLRQLLDKYDNDTTKALAAYNAGPGNVDKYNGIPPFTETQDYVSRIMEGYSPLGQKGPTPLETPAPTPIPTPVPQRTMPPAPNPVAQSLQTQSQVMNQPTTYDFEVTDPKTGHKYIMNGESEPTDEDIDTYIAQFEQENPQRPAPANADPSGLSDPAKQKTPGDWDAEGKFGQGVLEQSQAAQAAKDPIGTAKGIYHQMVTAGGDPIKFLANGVMDMAKHSYENAKTELDHIGQEDKGDDLTRFSRVAGALASTIPVFGDLVKPMREGIPVDPNTPIDVPRVAGNAVGVGVDAALARFTPETGMAGIEAGGRGMTRAGGAMALNADARLARNAAVRDTAKAASPQNTFFRRANSLLSLGKKGGAIAAATAINPALGTAVGLGLGGKELASLLGKSDSLARLQGRVGRSMLPDAPNMWTGEAINPALIPDEGMIGPEFKPEVSGSEWSRAGAVREPNLASENTGVAYADPAPDLEALWDDNPQANKHMDSVQDSSGDIELPKPVPTAEELWRASNEADAPRSLQDDLGDIAPEEITPTVPKPPQEQWEALNLEDLEKSFQDTNEPIQPATLPEIKGKEGKRLYGEDQNRVSRPGKPLDNDGELADLDPLDNKEIDLDEPEIVGRGNKLVDTTIPPKEKPKVEIVDKTIPFADLEPGNRVRTANGKEGILEAFDEKSVTVKWDNGTRNKIARKAVSKVEEVKQARPKDELEDIDLSSLEEPVPEPKVETELEKAAREASESIDEPIEDIFGSEPKRKASGARTKIEPQYPKAKDRLPVYKISGEPTPRSELTNLRSIGDSPRQLGLNDRAISSSKVGWELTPEKIKKSLSQGQGHIQVNIDELFELAKKDINRPGRKNQSVGKSNKLERAQNFLASKNKEGVFTPEISVSNGKVIIDDGYHRTAAAKSMGEKSVPVRVSLQDLHLLKELGLKYRKLWDE